MYDRKKIRSAQNVTDVSFFVVIGAFEPGDIGHFAHHGSAAFRLLAAHNLRLDIEDLQPQPEVGPDAEESLAHDDERRDVEDEIWGQIMEIQAVVEHEPPDKW